MPGRIHATLIALCLLLPGTIFAASPHDRLPFYAGFALGFSAADSDCDYYGYNCDGTDTAFKAYGGKFLHENFAVEIAFHDLGKLKDKDNFVTTTADSQGVNLSLLGIIPVEGIGYFYGKAGMMAWEADYRREGATITTSDEDGTDFTYGAGFAASFADKYELRIEYERLNEFGDDFVSGGSSVTQLNLSGTIYLE